MSTIIPLANMALSKDCVVYKHFTICPISASAGREARSTKTAFPLFWINMREQRKLSNRVAETCGVDRESPQLILLKAGKPSAVWTHYKISRACVRMGTFPSSHLSHWRLGTRLLEGINNRVRVIKKVAYGRRNDEYFFFKIRMVFPGNTG
jgi:bacillithiol system protein YtxJ